MAVYLSPIFGAGAQLLTSQGVVLAGGSINTYIAGTTTPQATYTDVTGLVSNGSSIVLDSAGRPPQEIWIPAGVSIKIIVLNSVGVQQGITYDWISGVNDPSASVAPNTEWIASGLVPSYISASSFSVTGDQRAKFPVGQRVKYVVTAGTAYGTVLSVAFAAVTTVTIQADSTGLDTGLSAVSYGLFNAANPSVSAIGVAYSNTVPSAAGTLQSAVQRGDRSTSLTTSTGIATAFVLTPTTPLAAYATNAPLLVRFHLASGVSPTLNVSGLGAINLKQLNGAGAKVAASFPINQIVQAVYDGTDMVLLFPASSGRYLRTTVFTAGGTWTKGSDVGSIRVRGVGGGGGVAPSTGSGGGGSGGYFEKTIASPTAAYTVGIGAGGSLGGGSGGNTTFDVVCTGNGGSGVAGPIGTGGSGGTATGGDINLTGAGGGWGAASTNAYYGNGGSSYFGGGAAGNVNNATGAVGSTNTGGGASGGSTTGAAGGSGIVLVEEFS